MDMLSSFEADDVDFSTECEIGLTVGLRSHDDNLGDAFETPVSKACTNHRVIVGLTALVGISLCAGALKWKHHWHGRTNVNLDQFQRKFEGEMMVNDMIKGLWGNTDPFKFRCPLPLSLVVTSIGGILKNSTQAAQVAPSAALGAKSQCCTLYNASWWPYQYPECRQDSSCPSCWKAADANAQRYSEVVGVAGVAWAAANAVYESDHKDFMKETKTQVFGSPMMASLTSGLRTHVANVCPKIADWRQYNFESAIEGLRVVAFKSTSAKIAVISFRGTEPANPMNWMVDMNMATEQLRLGKDGPTANVHSGFLDALRNLMPKIQKWVNGYWIGFGKVPEDWKLVFTGHSMGAAFAILAATLAVSEDWNRAPDAIVTYASPRIGDATLSDWWEEKGLCKKLLRVNVYNDIVHWLPFAKQSSVSVSTSLEKCVLDVKSCFRSQLNETTEHFDKWWRHVCPNSEFLVPGAIKGVNGELDDLNLLGGGLAHKLSDCNYGYGYGVLNAGIDKADSYCGLNPEICPKFSCTTVEDLSGQTCTGLRKDTRAKTAAECRDICCVGESHGEFGTCEVWQWMKKGECWVGRSHDCTSFSLWAHDVINSSRIK